jgi:hypothetical protein
MAKNHYDNVFYDNAASDDDDDDDDDNYDYNDGDDDDEEDGFDKDKSTSHRGEKGHRQRPRSLRQQQRRRRRRRYNSSSESLQSMVCTFCCSTLAILIILLLVLVMILAGALAYSKWYDPHDDNDFFLRFHNHNGNKYDPTSKDAENHNENNLEGVSVPSFTNVPIESSAGKNSQISNSESTTKDFSTISEFDSPLSVPYNPYASLQYYNPFNITPGDWYAAVTFPTPTYSSNSHTNNPQRLGYLSQPNIVGKHLVFVTEGDLYYSPFLSNGNPTAAIKLSTTVGNVRTPVLNPEYPYLVAFTATYTAHREVYLLDLRPDSVNNQGAIRLTYWDTSHGISSVVGWKDEGRTLIFSAISHDISLPDTRLYQMPLLQPDGTLSTPSTKSSPSSSHALTISPVPLAQATEGAWFDGCWYFTRYKQSSHTVRYTGGTAESLWAWCEGENLYRHIKKSSNRLEF